MARTRAVTLQDVLTMSGPNNTDMAVQNEEFFVDVSGHDKVVVHYSILNADTVTLYLETAQVKDKKYWRTTKSWAAEGTGSVVLTRDAGLTSEFLENFLRWRIAASDTTWKLTFRLQLFLK